MVKKTENKLSAKKDVALKTAIEKINKDFGENSIMIMGENASIDTPSFSSGSFFINKALGIDGYPIGRIIEIFGPESSGKTTLTLHAIAEAQKAGMKCAFIDAEHAIDPEYAKNIGVDIDALLLSQPDSGEQALEITETLVRSSSVGLIVIDSVAALTPKAEIDGDMGDSHMGLQARLMSQALRKLTSSVSKTKTTIIFINQLRMKIGVMFGNPETTTGGNALKFYASVRIDIRKRSAIKIGDNIIGNDVTVKIVKNKVAPPFKIANIKIIFGRGISKPHELVAIGLENKTVIKSGAWYSVNEQRFQGEQNLVKELDTNKELVNFILSGEQARPA